MRQEINLFKEVYKMRKVFPVSVILLIFGLSIFGQKSKADIEQLKKEINLPAYVSVDVNDVKFPSAKTIKIYSAIKHNRKSADEFTKWVAEWNKSNAAQYGELQMVDKLEDADVAAVQYQFGTGRVVREESIRLKTGKVPGGNPSDATRNSEDDRFVLNGIGNKTVRAESTVRNLTLPLYSYLIVRGENSSWSVDYSRLDARIDDRNFPELLLQSAIEKRLKNR